MKFSKLTFFVLLAFCLSAAAIPAFALQHFSYHRGSVNKSVTIDAATFDGVAIVPDDEVGVFTPGGVCAGAQVLTDNPDIDFGLAAWEDDEWTNPIDGFQWDEEMSFRIWLHDVDQEYEAEITNISMGNAVYDGEWGVALSINVPHIPTPANIEVSSLSLEFGTWPVGGSSSMELTLRNTGELDLVVSSADVTGSEYFTTDFAGEVTLETEQTHTFNVTFAPGAEGNLEATLTINSNDADSPQVQVALTGTGHQPSPPHLVVITRELGFGTVWLGNSEMLNALIRNTGELDLVVNSATIEGSGFFSVDFPEGGEMTLVSGQEGSFTVTFAPTEVGDFQGNLVLGSNEEANPVVQIPLTGAGYQPTPPNLEPAANEFSFPDTRIGRTRSWSLVITNTGDETLLLQGVTFNREDDVFTSNFRDEIAIEGHSQTQIAVFFTPPEIGAYDATMTLASNDPDSPELGISLAGNGVEAGAAEIALKENERFFPHVQIRETAHWRMTILNIGGDDLWIYSIASDNAAFATDFGANSVRLRPEDHFNVDVTFTPESEAFYNGVLTINSSDPDNGALTCPVLGEGVLADNSHFRYYRSDANHSLFVESVTLDGASLVAGDEIGIYTPAGLCAGGGVVTANNNAGAKAFGDDPQSDIVDGFQADEAFTFMVWDASAGVEATATPTFAEGPEVFTADGVTRLTLEAAVVAEPRITLSHTEHFFGQADYDDHQVKSWKFTIANPGTGNLTLELIESDLGVFEAVIGENYPAVLLQNERLDVIVNFAPTAEERYVGRLTITSDDPVDPVLYVDLYGEGVVEVIEPDIQLGAENCFFGAQHLLPQGAAPYERTLNISNIGGGDLVVSDITFEGNGYFNTNWPGERVVIQSGGSYDLTLYYAPLAVGDHSATLHIFSNDPVDSLVNFGLYGKGVDSRDHFIHIETGTSHLIRVDEAIITTLGGVDTPLIAGDEVAVFTPEGLCAGHRLVSQQDVDQGLIPLTAWGDDPNTNYVDGFIARESFIFKFWDWTTRDQLNMDIVEFTNGPELFQVNGQSNVNLRAQALHNEAQIAVSPDWHQFDPLRVNESASFAYAISNTGGNDLTITGVQSSLGVFTTDFGNNVVLDPGESFDLNVTFTPAGPIGYEATLTIASYDPDEPNFVVNVGGLGSSAQGHFVFFKAERNHSILIEQADIGGTRPSIGDEFAVFTSSGMCAGAYIVDDPVAGIGVAAWGDIADASLLVEGFANNETMTLHFWDASQQREYIQGAEEQGMVVEVTQGALRWGNNRVTVCTVTVEGVMSITMDPPENPIRKYEGEQVQFDLAMVNEGELDFGLAVAYPEGFPNADAAFVDNGDNTASFVWDISYETIDGANRPKSQKFDLVFSATSGEINESITVEIKVIDVNRDPELIAPLQDDQIVIEEDWPRTLVGDLDDMFSDPDGDPILFYYEANAVIKDSIDRNTNQYYVMAPADVSGEFDMIVVADDLKDRDLASSAEGRTLRRIGDLDRDVAGPSRSLRKLDGSLAPDRDAPTEYHWTLVVTGINDAPEIQQPSAQARIAKDYDELGNIVIDFGAADVDNPGDQLDWIVADADGLPGAPGGEWNFVDANNGAAQFTWTPTQERARANPYTVVYQVSDGALTDQITIDITINDVNRRPEVNLNAPDTVQIVEDGGRQNLMQLDTNITDPDVDDQLTFELTLNPAQLNLQIDNNGLLTALPLQNFNTFFPQHTPARVTVRATDLHRGFVDYPFLVDVLPVNDPPAAFRLTNPLNQTVYDDSLNVNINFQWDVAAQNRNERDSVRYWATIKATGFEDSLLIGPLVRNNYLVGLHPVVDSLGIWYQLTQRDIEVTWSVAALDAQFTVIASNAPFTFTIPRQVGVRSDPITGVPDNYYISRSYPNPFNARTTVAFGLPKADQVDVSIWDMHGRKVATLATGRFEAGRYETVWNAVNSTSGVYIIRMETPNFRGLQKAILMR